MSEKMKKFIPVFILLGVVFVAFIIYVVVNRLGMPTVASQPANFWLGLWQGAIVILSFVTSLFDKSINIYQVGNNGAWYNFGYMIGLSIALGGGGRSTYQKKKKS